MFPMHPAPPTHERTHEEQEAYAQSRRKMLAHNRRAGVAALANVSWYLDEYGYQDEDEVGYEQRAALRELFDSYASAWKGSHKVLDLIAREDTRGLTAGEIRKAMK
jgi:hypothetical protein